jgi:hypothetical protein
LSDHFSNLLFFQRNFVYCGVTRRVGATAAGREVDHRRRRIGQENGAWDEGACAIATPRLTRYLAGVARARAAFVIRTKKAFEPMRLSRYFLPVVRDTLKEVPMASSLRSPEVSR